MERRAEVASWTACSSASKTSARLPRLRLPSSIRKSCWFPMLKITHPVTLGLSRNRSGGGSKVIRLLLIIHNGIILDLVCGFGG